MMKGDQSTDEVFDMLWSALDAGEHLPRAMYRVLDLVASLESGDPTAKALAKHARDRATELDRQSRESASPYDAARDAARAARRS